MLFCQSGVKGVGPIGVFLVMCGWLGAWCYRTEMFGSIAYFVVIWCLTCVLNKLGVWNWYGSVNFMLVME